MNVFVDDAKEPGSKDRHTSAWSHLFARPGTDPGQLHSFASRLGIPCSAFNADRHPHYKVTEAKRREAIREGAYAVSVADAARIILSPDGKPAPTFGSAHISAGEPQHCCQVPGDSSGEERQDASGWRGDARRGDDSSAARSASWPGYRAQAEPEAEPATPDPAPNLTPRRTWSRPSSSFPRRRNDEPESTADRHDDHRQPAP